MIHPGHDIVRRKKIQAPFHIWLVGATAWTAVALRLVRTLRVVLRKADANAFHQSEKRRKLVSIRTVAYARLMLLRFS